MPTISRETRIVTEYFTNIPLNFQWAREVVTQTDEAMAMQDVFVDRVILELQECPEGELARQLTLRDIEVVNWREVVIQVRKKNLTGLTSAWHTQAQRRRRRPDYRCLECGKNYFSTAAAERATRNGCSCGSTDIDVAV